MKAFTDIFITKPVLAIVVSLIIVVAGIQAGSGPSLVGLAVVLTVVTGLVFAIVPAAIDWAGRTLLLAALQRLRGDVTGGA